MKKYLLILGIISLLIITGCYQQPAAQPTQPAAEISPAEPAAPIQAEVPAPGQAGKVVEKVVVPAPVLREFDMTAKKWDFTPSTITVNEGDVVRLNIKSEDVTHGFALFEFGVNERLTPGKTTTVEFIADKAGEYTFFCSVPCGSGHGNMNGKLIVE